MSNDKKNDDEPKGSNASEGIVDVIIAIEYLNGDIVIIEDDDDDEKPLALREDALVI